MFPYYNSYGYNHCFGYPYRRYCGYYGYPYGYGYPYNNIVNSQIANSNQLLYNSGYMAGVSQVSAINNIAGFGGYF